MSRSFGGWAPYVPVAARRRKAEREMKKLRKKGAVLSPVKIEGRQIARTFGARRGATTWRVIAIMRTGYRGGAPTCATARWSIYGSHPAR